MSCRLLMAALIVVVAAEGSAQQATRSPSPVLPAGGPSLWIFGGMSWPLSRSGFTEYWQAGPAGAVDFTTNVSRRLSVGIELDAAAYWFRAEKFVASHPGVPLRNTPVAMINIALIGRYELMKGKKFGPYIGLALGAVRITEAVYQQIVDSVRVTYYSIPAKTRLTMACIGGAEYKVSRKFALDGEARLMYVHHDPDVGLTLTVRAGVRFTL